MRSRSDTVSNPINLAITIQNSPRDQSVPLVQQICVTQQSSYHRFAHGMSDLLAFPGRASISNAHQEARVTLCPSIPAARVPILAADAMLRLKKSSSCPFRQISNPKDHLPCPAARWDPSVPSNSPIPPPSNNLKPLGFSLVD